MEKLITVLLCVAMAWTVVTISYVFVIYMWSVPLFQSVATAMLEVVVSMEISPEGARAFKKLKCSDARDVMVNVGYDLVKEAGMSRGNAEITALECGLSSSPENLCDCKTNPDRISRKLLLEDEILDVDLQVELPAIPNGFRADHKCKDVQKRLDNMHL